MWIDRIIVTVEYRYDWLVYPYAFINVWEENFVKKGINQVVRKELGLYIHIPFCVKKCRYCDFLSSTGDDYVKGQYVEALLREIRSYKELAERYLVKTIYIGGGTPSSLEAEHIVKIMETIKEVFTIYGICDKVERKKTFLSKLESIAENENGMAEITIEVNPGTITKEKLEAYRSVSINRLSIGLQSADNEELKLLGRIHTYEEFEQNYYIARETGFNNINVDLISGLPNQGVESFLHTLNKVIELNPEHISAYSLIVEQGTDFYRRYGEGAALEKELPTEETDREIYEKTKEILERNQYYRYEISNYAKQGFESKHNSSYWKRTEYLGMGLGASSLMDNARFQNEDDLVTYVSLSADYHNLRRDMERLVVRQQMEEFMFLGLRLCEGVRKSEFKERFQINIETVYGSVLNKLKKEELLMMEEDSIFLTERGLDLSNYAMAQFLLEDFVRS